MNRFALVIFSFVVFLAACLLWYLMWSESQTASDVTGISILSDQDPVAESTLIKDSSTTNDEKFTPTVQPNSLEIQPIPTTPKPEILNFDNLIEVTAENLDWFTNNNLEDALSGDLEAGFRVGELRKRCFDVPKSSQLLEIRIENQSRFVSELNRLGRDFPTYQINGPQMLFPTNEENRIHQTRWFNACRAQSQIFNLKFRERLEYLANRGNVIARYLYAIWPIEPLEMAEGFLGHQAWAAKAAEFSFLNLEEGEIAGQLAFGQSYFSGGLFTSKNRYVSYALFTSAVSCGFSEAGIEAIVNDYFNSEQNKDNSDNIRLRVVSMANELETYCH